MGCATSARSTASLSSVEIMCDKDELAVDEHERQAERRERRKMMKNDRYGGKRPSRLAVVDSRSNSDGDRQIAKLAQQTNKTTEKKTKRKTKKKTGVLLKQVDVVSEYNKLYGRRASQRLNNSLPSPDTPEDDKPPVASNNGQLVPPHMQIPHPHSPTLEIQRAPPPHKKNKTRNKNKNKNKILTATTATTTTATITSGAVATQALRRSSVHAGRDFSEPPSSSEGSRADDDGNNEDSLTTASLSTLHTKQLMTDPYDQPSELDDTSGEGVTTTYNDPVLDMLAKPRRVAYTRGRAQFSPNLTCDGDDEDDEDAYDAARLEREGLSRSHLVRRSHSRSRNSGPRVPPTSKSLPKMSRSNSRNRSQRSNKSFYHMRTGTKGKNDRKNKNVVPKSQSSVTL